MNPRDAVATAIRIPLGAGRFLAQRLPKPIGTPVGTVVNAVASRLPQPPGPVRPTPDPTAEAGPVAEPETGGPRKAHGDPTGPAAGEQVAEENEATTGEPTGAATAEQVAAAEENEVTTPVGTTGADVATNPDTTDTDLQQPGTEPLMDPSTTKKVAKEAEQLGRAADVKKD